jgi:hypothetical protein
VTGTIDIPKIGPVKKPVVIAVGVGAVGMLGYAYYRSRSSAATDTTDPTSPDYVDPGTLPAVAGAVDDSNLYGSGTSTSTTTSDYGFTGTSNSQWTQYATTQLQQSDSWSYTDIVTALGNFVNNKALTATQQQIVQAAIAVAGYPPEGSHTIIPGGDTSPTVAPTGVHVTSTTTTTVALSWTAVAGADGYRIYRSGVSQVVGEAFTTSGTVGGLTPNTSYSFSVAAHNSSGTIGPKSSAVSAKTKGVTLATPHVPTISAVSRSSAHGTTAKVTNATGYNWYLNGVAHGHSDAPSYTFQGLKPKTRYEASVAADTATGAPGKQSARKSFTTKK